MNALDYFLKANLYGLLLAGCYVLLLRRHTFFGLNRIYLLASAVLSLVLPLATLPSEAPETLPIPTGVIILPATIAPAETGPDWAVWGAWGYGVVALVLLAALLTRVFSLLRTIRQSEKIDYSDHIQVLPTNSATPTFSFFQYVVLSPADRDNALILQHELVHVRQWHSVDVLAMQVLRSLFWACPALWLLERALRQVHEFLADQQASAYERNYARLLVDYSFGLQPVSLANGFFNPSLLKQRIQMLQQRATSRWALGKYVLIAPLVLSLLAMTTARDEITDLVADRVSGQSITVSGRVINAADGKAISGAVVMNGTKAATTNQNGFYKLSNIDSRGKLVISSLGYRTDILLLTSLSKRIKHNALTLNPSLTPTLEDELPAMGSTSDYKAVKPNPSMPLKIVPTRIVKNGVVFTAASEPAIFPTGVPGLMNYVAHNLHYPTKARAAGLEGDVYVTFTISPTGKVKDAKVNRTLKSVGGGCEEEAIRVVSKMPNWIPAKQNGQPVTVRYQIPIRFELENLDANREVISQPAGNARVVSGKVVSAVDGKGLPGATIIIKDQTRGTTTNAKGEYKINTSPSESLIFSFVGFKSQLIKVANRSVINVALATESPAVNKKKVTAAPATKQPESRSFVAVNDKGNAHLTIYSEGSSRTYSLPDSMRKTKVSVKAPSGAKPLYIIDGVEQPDQELKALDPNAIESINVLKGDHTATYGVRGKDGVILITTKKK
ncbi:TonB family protein [Spirosoma sp. KUDC1026]|uniref:TonB family protein n=1 Tax=Spirosoma sp. KUDC1026 TaxID=2745947 RepID=UPI00159BE501|nr:TonB family protein [Spirosoma sp. KUDC1026]QKZ11199.1 TonB family protein [Spirosoma sp. KUDC1026]